MPNRVYRYCFNNDVDPADVESSLVLAILACQSLHGEAQVQLDASHFWDAAMRTCVIDAGTVVGRDIARLFLGFLRREFQEDQYVVRRIESPQRAVSTNAGARDGGHGRP